MIIFFLLNQSNSMSAVLTTSRKFPVIFCAVNSSIYGVKYDDRHISNIQTDIGQIKTLIYVQGIAFQARKRWFKVLQKPQLRFILSENFDFQQLFKR